MEPRVWHDGKTRGETLPGGTAPWPQPPGPPPPSQPGLHPVDGALMQCGLLTSGLAQRPSHHQHPGRCGPSCGNPSPSSTPSPVLPLSLLDQFLGAVSFTHSGVKTCSGRERTYLTHPLPKILPCLLRSLRDRGPQCTGNEG